MKRVENLRERQREMAERHKQEKTIRLHTDTRMVYPKSKQWLQNHFVEIIERLIDDLGLDVPRREH
jgi:hypothetical protein